MAAIELEGITKRYGDVTALESVDLTIESGEVFGFLGPNGAGKSTTIDILLDHARPTDGQARVFDMDAQAETVAVRERIGVLPERFGPLGEMTGRQHVEFVIDVKDADDDPDTILDRVGITGAADRLVKGYSKGMTQRLMLGMALVGHPDLLILDEPTTGLDPNGARQMRQIVTEERDRGATVFFSSHILEQVEAVSDRVGILDQGNLVAVDSIDGLRDAAGTTGEIAVTLDAVPDGLTERLEGLDDVMSVHIEETTITVGCENPAKGDVVWACRDTGAEIRNIETSEASLEDLFAAYTEDI